MNTLVADKQTYTLPEALKILKERVASSREGGTAQRIEINVEPQDILSWLCLQANPVKLYWQDRKREFTAAGVGAARTVKGDSAVNYASLLAQIKENLSARHRYARYYGGICFDAGCAHPKGAWSDFGAFRFILPRVELFSAGRTTALACNFFPGRETRARVLEELSRLTAKSEYLHTQTQHPKSRTDCPDKAAWQISVRDAISACRNKDYQKVVLARKSTFTFNSAVNPFAVLKRLNQLTSDCFVFSFQFSDGAAFLGASPERLFKREGKSIRTEAIAGTRKRGRSEAEDKLFRRDLSRSAKDSCEHQIVVDAIRENLAPLCESLRIDSSPSVLSLKGGHHLISQCQGRLKEGIRDADVLSALHPTPAVAGCPTEKALNEIRAKEPFSRGWYAGPVGCVGKEETEFIVAIRSGLLRGTALDLFAGAGIVDQSDALDEWNETEHKLDTFLKIFDPSDRGA